MDVVSFSVTVSWGSAVGGALCWRKSAGTGGSSLLGHPLSYACQMGLLGSGHTSDALTQHLLRELRAETPIGKGIVITGLGHVYVPLYVFVGVSIA